MNRQSFKYRLFQQHLAALLLSVAAGLAPATVCAQGAGVKTTPPAAPPPAPVSRPGVPAGRGISPTPPAAPQPPVAQAVVAQPLQVITIVHRLSGMKLQMWLSFTDAKMVNPGFMEQFVYTNIVAGYVLPDGRSVIARLPEAEAEMLSVPFPGFKEGAPKAGLESSGLTLFRRDGAQMAAKFVGLDGSTWLSLLQADGLSLPPSRDAEEESLTVGQRVRLFAPLRADRATMQLQPGAGTNSNIYMRVGEIRGTVSNITRSSTGRVTRLSVRAAGLTPQIVGSVVLNEAGETVGLVETTANGEARVMPASVVKRAAERVLRRRASVPRPLLGVRGEAISATTVKQLEQTGWKLKEAYDLLTKQEGVLLTMVAPNSPAALANLRAGDIITRVNDGFVKTSEDFSFLLNEAGGNAFVNFTVLRAESAPLEVTVKLSEALNLRRATAMGVGFGTPSAAPSAPTAPAPPTAASATGTGRGSTASPAPVAVVAATPGKATTVRVTPEAVAAAAVPPVRPTMVADLDYIILPAEKSSPRRPRLSAKSVLLINAVRPGSDADRLGLRSGDLVLSVNGKPLMQNEWPEKFLLQTVSDLQLVVMRGPERLTLRLKEKE